MEVYVDDEAKLTLNGLQQHYVKLKENEKNKKLFELLDVLEFNQVCFANGYFYSTFCWKESLHDDARISLFFHDDSVLPLPTKSDQDSFKYLHHNCFKLVTFIMITYKVYRYLKIYVT